MTNRELYNTLRKRPVGLELLRFGLELLLLCLLVFGVGFGLLALAELMR
jgi:hypothetical protein